jgi:hypothetical protein
MNIKNMANNENTTSIEEKKRSKRESKEREMKGEK